MATRPQRARMTRVEVVALAANWAVSILTTAVLAAIGWFGHATHWTFGFGGHDDHHAAAPAVAPPPAAPPSAAADSSALDASAAAVSFPSREAMDRTGIELVPVEERPVVSEIVASGVVQYDQRNVAQLSARVPGSVWRVEKHLGDVVRKGDVLLLVESRDVGRLKADFLNALVAHESRREQLAILGAGRVTRGRGRPCRVARTFASALRASAHSEPAALRHPWLRLPPTPAPRHGRPLAESGGAGVHAGV